MSTALAPDGGAEARFGAVNGAVIVFGSGGMEGAEQRSLGCL
ncbi:MAG TPA: hypothetical protein VMM27_16475 [Casimicrobiaceae bacterium]|nr:hypothetical protein [Casimicrobiaceae bacterium]